MTASKTLRLICSHLFLFKVIVSDQEFRRLVIEHRIIDLVGHILIQAAHYLLWGHIVDELDVHILAHRLNTYGQGGGEDDFRLRVKALGVPQGKLRASDDLHHRTNEVEVGYILKASDLHKFNAKVDMRMILI